jgi:hypothetical protein
MASQYSTGGAFCWSLTESAGAFGFTGEPFERQDCMLKLSGIF